MYGNNVYANIIFEKTVCMIGANTLTFFVSLLYIYIAK